MSKANESEFGLDPRKPHLRSGRWENVDSLDNLNMARFMEVLNHEHHVGLSNRSSILEIGLGEARLFKRLKAEGYDVTGVEARRREEHTPDLPIVHIRIEEMPFEGNQGTFEMVIADSVFDSRVYDQDQQLMLSRVVDALSSHGIFVSDRPISIDYEAAGLRRLYLPETYEMKIFVYQKTTL